MPVDLDAGNGSNYVYLERVESGSSFTGSSTSFQGFPNTWIEVNGSLDGDLATGTLTRTRQSTQSTIGFENVSFREVRTPSNLTGTAGREYFRVDGSGGGLSSFSLLGGNDYLRFDLKTGTDKANPDIFDLGEGTDDQLAIGGEDGETITLDTELDTLTKPTTTTPFDPLPFATVTGVEDYRSTTSDDVEDEVHDSPGELRRIDTYGGDDSIEVENGVAQIVNCGDGEDRILSADPDDDLRECELGPQPIIVNDTGDGGDETAGAPCDADEDTSGEQCTLRAAIELANDRGGSAAIGFDLPADSVIAPASAYEPLGGKTTLDGTNDDRAFTIDGSSAGAGVDGLVLEADESAVDKLTVEGFDGSGVVFEGSDSILTGSTIGDPTGTNGNGVGVEITGDGTMIGSLPDEGGDPVSEPSELNNTISGNGDPAGLLAEQQAGTSTAASHTGGYGAGVIVDGAGGVEILDNFIGLPSADGLGEDDVAGGAGRTLAGGNSVGVVVKGGTFADAIVDGNRLIGNNTGLFKTGGPVLGAYANDFRYGWAGLSLNGAATGTEVGQVADGGGNTFVANGIGVELLAVDGGALAANEFRDNSTFGLLAVGGNDVAIGGVDPDSASAFFDSPIGAALINTLDFGLDGINFSGAGGIGALVLGSNDTVVNEQTGGSIVGGLAGIANIDSAFTEVYESSIRNNDWGIFDRISHETAIGAEGAANQVADNTVGIELAVSQPTAITDFATAFGADADTQFAVQRLTSIADIAPELEVLGGGGSPTHDDSATHAIRANLIGTDSSFTAEMPNDEAIKIGHDVSGVEITDYNRIVNSTDTAVAIGGTKPDGAADPEQITIRENVIDQNGVEDGDPPTSRGLGIDLYTDALGPTLNDGIGSDPDLDEGPNGLQNFPRLVSAKAESGGVEVVGDLESLPNKTYNVDFYEVDDCHPSGFGEGGSPVGSTQLTTDDNGFVALTETVDKAAGADGIAAIATDPDGNSSEFSRCIEIQGAEIEGVVSYPDGTPVEGVKVKLSGKATAEQTTNQDGEYIFEELEEGDYTVTPQDADGRWRVLGTSACVNPGDDLTSCTATELDRTIIVDVQTTCGPRFLNLKGGDPLAKSPAGVPTNDQRDQGTSVISFGSLEAYGCFYHQPDGRYISDPGVPFRINGIDYAGAGEVEFNPGTLEVKGGSAAMGAGGFLFNDQFPTNETYLPGALPVNYPGLIFDVLGFPAKGAKVAKEAGSTKFEVKPKVPDGGIWKNAKVLEEALEGGDGGLSASTELVLKTSNKDGLQFDAIKLELERDMKVDGFALKKLTLEFSQGDKQWKITGDFVLPSGIGGRVTGFFVPSSTETTLPLWQRSAELSGVELGLTNINRGPLGQTGLFFQDLLGKLKIVRQTDPKSGERSLSVSVGPTVGFSFLPRLKDGVFVPPTKRWSGAPAAVKTPPVPSFLKDVGVTDVSRIVDFQGKGDLTVTEKENKAGKQISGTAKLTTEGTATLFKDHPFAEMAIGNAKATLEAPYVDPAIPDGEAALLRSKLDFTGTIGFTAPFDIFQLNSTVSGWVVGHPEPFFQVETTKGGSTLVGKDVKRALISPRAVAVCRNVGFAGAEVTGGVTWNWDLSLDGFDWLDSCDFSSFGKPKPFAVLAASPAGASVSGPDASVAARKLKLPGKTDAVGYAFEGNGAPPKLELKGRGLTVKANKTRDGKTYSVYMDPNTNTTYVFIADPPKGKLKVKPLKGSKIKKVETAKALPDSNVRANVKTLGNCSTRVLTVRQRKARGQTVSLYEVGPTSRESIGTAKGKRDKLRFQPAAASSSERREIVAQVLQDGVPRGSEEALDAYRISAGGTLLLPPKKLKAKRKGKRKLKLSWKKGCGASGYRVEVRKGKKKLVKKTIAKRKLTLKAAKRGKLKISVSSIADDGSVSQPATTKVKLGGKNRKGGKRR